MGEGGHAGLVALRDVLKITQARDAASSAFSLKIFIARRLRNATLSGMQCDSFDCLAIYES
jgi:hypothetical protein